MAVYPGLHCLLVPVCYTLTQQCGQDRILLEMETFFISAEQRKLGMLIGESGGGKTAHALALGRKLDVFYLSFGVGELSVASLRVQMHNCFVVSLGCAWCGQCSGRVVFPAACW